VLEKETDSRICMPLATAEGDDDHRLLSRKLCSRASRGHARTACCCGGRGSLLALPRRVPGRPSVCRSHQSRGHGFEWPLEQYALPQLTTSERRGLGKVVVVVEAHLCPQSAEQPWAGAPDRAGETRERQRVGGGQKAGQGTDSCARSVGRRGWCNRCKGDFLRRA
jgi:hypothetical protein